MTPSPRSSITALVQASLLDQNSWVTYPLESSKAIIEQIPWSVKHKILKAKGYGIINDNASFLTKRDLGELAGQVVYLK